MCYGMAMRLVVVLYVAAMIALIVGLDLTLFRHHFWERLAVNIGIVLVFAAFYVRFLQSR
jgi:cytochrome c oxidase subunit IV